MAGAEPGRWRLIRQRGAEEALAARREHWARRPVALPTLRVHAIDPVTGDSACGYQGAVTLKTSWYETPVANRCPQCVWRMASDA